MVGAGDDRELVADVNRLSAEAARAVLLYIARLSPSLNVVVGNSVQTQLMVEAGGAELVGAAGGSADEAPGRSRSWADMTLQHRAAAGQLGYNATTWDAGEVSQTTE